MKAFFCLRLVRRFDKLKLLSFLVSKLHLSQHGTILLPTTQLFYAGITGGTSVATTWTTTADTFLWSNIGTRISRRDARITPGNWPSSVGIWTFTARDTPNMFTILANFLKNNNNNNNSFCSLTSRHTDGDKYVYDPC